MSASGERFDQRYFDRWYRREGFGARARLDRKVAYAVSAAEYLLQRRVRTVLDIGCGEGAWQPALARLRPAARYRGVDPSRYAIERFGARRNLTLGGLKELAGLDLGHDVDLVVCVDVLGYATDRAVQAGLADIGVRLGGVALIEVFTSADDITGDLEHYRLRRPGTYDRWFADAGLARVGPHLYVGEAMRSSLARFEQP